MNTDPVHGWAVLVKAALVGTERLAPPESAPAVVAELAAAEPDAAARLLGQAALLSPLVRAGREAPTRRAAHADAPADALPEAGPVATHALVRILAPELAALLPEWCRAARGRRRVPDHLLPAFLDHLAALKSAHRSQPLLLAAGPRGAWLASQNPAWAVAMQPATGDIATVWATGTKADRAQALALRRAENPAEGRALLASTASAEPPDDLAEFVAALATGLSMDDHDFLEDLLDAKHKAVRVSAASLLARLPESGRSRRNQARAEARLAFERTAAGLLRRSKPQLVVTLPEKDEPAEAKALARDGIDTQKKRGKLGPKAVTLLQVVAGTPLRHFTQSWQATPGEILDAALDGDWSEALIVGFADAARVQRDEAWCAALLDRFAGRAGGLIASLDPGLAALFQVLPPDGQEAFVARIVEERPRAIHDGWMLEIVASMAHAWSEPFTRRVLDAVRSHYLYELHWPLRNLMPRLAAWMHPSAADYAAGGWPESSGSWTDGDRQMLANLTSTLALRRNYLKELSA